MRELKEFKPENMYANYISVPYIIYQGKKYHVLPNPKGENFIIVSTEQLSPLSELENRFYLTPVNVNDVEDYGNDVLYCKYKGKLYSILYYDDEFENLRIVSKESDNELGFEYVPHDNYYYKDVVKDEIDGIYYEEKSLLAELKEYKPDIFRSNTK